MKVIASQVGEVVGPIVQPATEPLYLDIGLQPGVQWTYTLPDGHNAFAYVFGRAAQVGEGADARPVAHELGVLGGGSMLPLAAGQQHARVLLVAGRPLRKPVARQGPFVMSPRAADAGVCRLPRTTFLKVGAGLPHRQPGAGQRLPASAEGLRFMLWVRSCIAPSSRVSTASIQICA